MNVKLPFLITSFLFVNICFSQGTEDTLRHQESNAGDEFAADRYSGFILFQMEATLEET